MIPPASAIDVGTLVFTSAVIAALVSTIIGGGFTLWNDHQRRAHETQLRTADQEHERLMLALADRRTQRDRKAARIYNNLHAIVDVALAVMLQVVKLRAVPQLYKQDAPEKEAALDKLRVLQPAIRLDRETDVLYERTVQAVIDYNIWWVALDERERVRAEGRESLAPFTLDAVERGEKLAALLAEIIAESRTALEKAEAALD